MILLGFDRLYLCLTSPFEWLDLLYYLSAVKLLITLLKYIPQVYLNFQRKSTQGWAIGTSLLDLIGGIFSLVQMILIAWDHGMYIFKSSLSSLST